MKRIATICVGALLAGVLLLLASEDGPATSPVLSAPRWYHNIIAWDQPLARESLPVCHGRKIVETYILQNISSEELHIDHIKPDCSCTSVVSDKYRIAPGDDFIITMEITASDKISYQELFDYHAYIYIAGQTEPLDISMRLPTYREMPLSMDFGRINSDKVIEKSFMLRTCDHTPPMISSVEVDDERVVVATEPSVDDPSVVLVNVALKNIDDYGAYSSEMRIFLDDGYEYQEYRTMIKAYIEYPIQALPDRISMGCTEAGTDVRVSIELQSTRNRSYDIHKVTSGIEMRDVQWKPLDTAKTRYAVNAVLRMPIMPGSVIDALEIETSDKENPVVLPIYGVVVE